MKTVLVGIWVGTLCINVDCAIQFYTPQGMVVDTPYSVYDHIFV